MIGDEEGCGGGAPDQGRAPADKSVGEEAIEEGEDEGDEDKREDRTEPEIDGSGIDAEGQGIQYPGEGGGGEEGECGKAENGTEADDGPIRDDPLRPGSATPDAPDPVEALFHRSDHLDNDDNQHQGADEAHGAGAGAGDDPVDESEELGIDIAGSDLGFRGGSIRVPRGGRRHEVGVGGIVGNPVPFGGRRRDEIDHPGDPLAGKPLVVTLEDKAGDHDRDREQGSEADQAVVAEGGGLAEEFVTGNAPADDGEDPQGVVEVAPESVSLQGCRFPDFLAEQVGQAAYAFSDLSDGFACHSPGRRLRIRRRGRQQRASARPRRRESRPRRERGSRQ